MDLLFCVHWCDRPWVPIVAADWLQWHTSASICIRRERHADLVSIRLPATWIDEFDGLRVTLFRAGCSQDYISVHYIIATEQRTTSSVGVAGRQASKYQKGEYSEISLVMKGWMRYHLIYIFTSSTLMLSSVTSIAYLGALDYFPAFWPSGVANSQIRWKTFSGSSGVIEGLVFFPFSTISMNLVFSFRLASRGNQLLRYFLQTPQRWVTPSEDCKSKYWISAQRMVLDVARGK